LIPIAARYGNAVGRDTGLYDDRPELMAKVIGLYPFPSQKLSDAIVAIEGMKTAKASFTSAKRIVNVRLPETI
jgi:hypothetical protein